MHSQIRRRILTAIIVLTSALTMAGSAASQTIVNSGSARAHGLGDMGAALIDHRSYTVNPASLALYAPRWDVAVTVGPYMQSDNEPGDISWRTAGAAVSFGRDRFLSSDKLCFGAAYWYGQFSYGEFIYTDEYGQTLGSFEPTNTSQSLALSIGYDAGARIGFGATLRSIRDEAVGIGMGGEVGLTSASTFGLDVGLQLSAPLNLSGSSRNIPVRSGFSLYPTLGVTLKNLLAEFDCEWGSKVEAPTEWRASLGILILQERHGFADASLLLAVEIEREKHAHYDYEYVHLGSELTLLETLSMRYGRVDNDDWAKGQTSWGIGFSSRGLVEYLAGEQHMSGELPVKSFLSRISLEVSYGKYNPGEYFLDSGVGFLDVALVITL